MTDQYTAGGTSVATGNDVYERILTHNHLYGFQLGVNGTFATQANRWRIDGYAKSGIFYNDAEQATALIDENANRLAVNNNNHVPAFFGEAGLVGYIPVVDHLAISGGYGVMFVNGVAQPVNQLAGTNLAGHSVNVDTSSGVFYHGATFAVELTW